MASLVIFSCIVAFFGLVFTSQVSAGPTIMGFAVLLAVFGRISQAKAQHAELMTHRAQKSEGQP